MKLTMSKITKMVLEVRVESGKGGESFKLLAYDIHTYFTAVHVHVLM